jgi:hypothetical protein
MSEARAAMNTSGQSPVPTENRTAIIREPV